MHSRCREGTRAAMSQGQSRTYLWCVEKLELNAATAPTTVVAREMKQSNLKEQSRYG